MLHLLTRSFAALAILSSGYAQNNPPTKQECIDFFGPKLNDCASDLSSINFNLIWVVDASGSVGYDNYVKQTIFVDQMSFFARECFTIGLNAAVVFSTSTRILPTYPFNFEYPALHTNTQQALTTAENVIGGRTDEINVVILLTDGVPNCARFRRSTQCSMTSTDILTTAAEQSRVLVLYTESGKYLLHRVWYIYEQEVKGGHFSWIA